MPFLFLFFVVSIAFAEDSLKVSQIHIETKNVFDDAVTHTSAERKLYRVGNIIHIKTRESVIGSRLPFKEGDFVSYAEIQEAEKNLRALPYISDAKIEAKMDSLGNADLYIETSDNWTFTPAVSIGKPGEEWLWAVGLWEHNLLGFGHTIGFFYKHEEDRDLKYLIFKTEDFIIPNQKFFFTISENSDGFERSLSLSYPFISQAKNQWAYNAEMLWSKRDEYYLEGLREDSLSLWLLRSFGGASFKTYLGIGYDFHKLEGRNLGVENRWMKDSRLGFSIAASHIRLDKRYNLHRVKWAEDVERGYYIKTLVAKNFKELQAENDDWYFEHIINLSAGTRKHNFLVKGQNYFYYNKDVLGDMRSSLFGEYIFKSSLRWASVLSTQVESWRGKDENSFPRQFYLDGNSIFPGFPLRYLAGPNTFAFKVEQRYFSGFEILTQIPSFAAFLTAGEATDRLRAFEPRDLLYMAGIGLRVSSSKSVQGIVNHINLSWPINGELSKSFVPRFSFIGKLEF